MSQINVMVKDFENEGDDGPLKTDDLESLIEAFLDSGGFDYGYVAVEVDG